MFEREQEINNQLEKSRKQLESEKTIFQNSVKVHIYFSVPAIR